MPGPTRRHKPWRTTYESLRIEGHHHDLPPSQTVEGAILGLLLSEYRRQQDAYFDGSSGLTGAWAESALSSSPTWCSPNPRSTS